MAKIRCKDCQYFDGVSRCGRYENLGERNKFSECISYEYTPNYCNCNHKDDIKQIIGDLDSLMEEDKCFVEPEENYKLEILTRKLLSLVESHGINSWKCKR